MKKIHRIQHNISNILYLIFTLVFCILLSGRGFSQSTDTTEKVDTCVQCHKVLEGRLAAPVNAMLHDIHGQKGLSCADCHGGDPTVGFKEMDYAMSMDKKKGYIGKPKPSEIGQFCAKCHGNAAYMKKYNPSLRTDQLEQYKTSIHGIRIAKGDVKVAQCISCHGYHGILSVDDPQSPVYPTNVPKTCAKCHADANYMKEYKIPTDQYDKYTHSVHGIALLQKGEVRSAPACNSCHGSHGAAPPGLSSVIFACGQCHAQNQDLYNSSPHKAAFEKNKLGACIVCHTNHGIQHPTDAMLGVGVGATCIQCHKAGDKGYLAAQMMASSIDQLKSNIQNAELETKKTANYGRDVSVATMKIKEAQDALIIGRTLVHTVSPEKLDKVVAPAEASTLQAVQVDKDATVDLKYRYIGLALFVLVALIVALLLYLKVRQLEK